MNTCPSCNSGNIIMVEYEPMSMKHYDGISEIECKDCHKRFGRWCGEELFDGEEENIHCEGESHE